MLCSVSIKYLAILMALYNQLQLVAYCEYSQNTVIILDKLLKCPGWGQINNVQAKIEKESFNCMDLYLNIVDASNVATNHRKATHLLACVYADAMLRFITYIQCVVKQSYRVSALMKNRLRGRKQHRLRVKNVSTNISTELDLLDYTKTWELLNLAVGEIKMGIPMFSCMSDALEYLMNLDVLMEGGDLKITDLNWLLVGVSQLQKLALNTNYILKEYREGYQNAGDSNVVKLNQDLNRFLLALVKSILSPFSNAYCILTDPVQEYMTIGRNTTDYNLPAVRMTIKTLVQEVVNKYQELGFEFIKQFQINHDKPEHSEVEN